MAAPATGCPVRAPTAAPPTAPTPTRLAVFMCRRCLTCWAGVRVVAATEGAAVPNKSPAERMPVRVRLRICASLLRRLQLRRRSVPRPFPQHHPESDRRTRGRDRSDLLPAADHVPIPPQHSPVLPGDLDISFCEFHTVGFQINFPSLLT